MPREKRWHVVCVPCWNDRGKEPREHHRYICADHRCVCCGFKAMEAAVKASAPEAEVKP